MHPQCEVWTVIELHSHMKCTRLAVGRCVHTKTLMCLEHARTFIECGSFEYLMDGRFVRPNRKEATRGNHGRTATDSPARRRRRA